MSYLVSQETIAEIERDIFSPIMDSFITLTTPDKLTEAINTNWNQAEWLENNPEGQEFVKSIHKMLNRWPMGWVSQAVEHMKKPDLLKWYVKEVLSQRHPEYYVRIAYNPNGMKYLLKTWLECLEVIY